MKKVPFRLRLTLMVALVFGVALGVASVVGIAQARRSLEADARAAATGDLEMYLASLDNGGQSTGSPDLESIDGIFYLDESGEAMTQADYERLINEAFAAELPGSFPAIPGTENAPDPGTTVTLEEPVLLDVDIVDVVGPIDSQDSQFQGRDRVVVSAPIEVGGVPVTIARSASLRPVEAGLSTLRWGLMVAVPALTALVALLTWYITGRALRPVNAMADQVESITTTNLDQRIPMSEAHDELTHLARTMNRMLGRLQHSRDRQRQFVSDASHELRSPVTAMAATLEVAATQTEPDWSATSEVLQAENRRLAALVDDLLLVARLDEGGEGSRRGPVDLEELCLAEATRTHPVGVQVHVTDPARVEGDAAMLERACRNLIDNAARHASSVVDVTISVDAGFAQVVVDDDGPGIPGHELESIFERFTRADPSRSRNEGSGAGLGLAIVRAVAVAHKGTVTADNSSRGARFTLRLPMT